MKAKVERVREAMESIDTIQSAESNPFLYEKIMHRLQNAARVIDIIQPKTLWRIAACILFLVVLNIFSVIHFRKAAENSYSNYNPVGNEYFSYMKNVQL